MPGMKPGMTESERFAGWVERSETRRIERKMVGFAALNSSCGL